MYTKKSVESLKIRKNRRKNRSYIRQERTVKKQSIGAADIHS